MSKIISRSNHTMFLLNDGTVKGCGSNGNGQLGIGNTTQQNSIVNIPITLPPLWDIPVYEIKNGTFTLNSNTIIDIYLNS